MKHYIQWPLAALLYCLLGGIQPSAAIAYPTVRTISNDLFYPRASERFFEEGLRQLGTEIDILRHSRSTQPPALNIDPRLLEQHDLQQQERPLQPSSPPERPDSLNEPL